MWKFTNHVLTRMTERGYIRDELLMILEGDVPAIIFPSPKEVTVDLYFGCIGEKYLMIPVDRTTLAIITVRPMRKNEKILFIKEIENDKSKS